VDDVCGVVLAGGLSSRMGFNKLAAMLLGHPVAWYPLTHLRNAGITRAIVVVGHEREEVQRALGEAEWVVQEEQLGTGHAAATVGPHLRGETTVAVLFGDCPFLDASTIKQTIDHHLLTQADMTITTAVIHDPWSLGIVRRGDDKCIEEVIPNQEVRLSISSHEIFAGLSIWKADVFKDLIGKLPEKHYTERRVEYELPDAIAMIRRAGGRVESIEVSEEDALGPNYPKEFRTAERYLSAKKVERLLESGVLIWDLSKIKADYDVTVGRGTALRGNVNLYGTTRIGSQCNIGPDSTLIDCVVGDGCTIGRGTWEREMFPAGSRASDQLTTRHDYFNKPYSLIAEDPQFAVMLMPFREPYMTLFANAIRPIVEEAGLTCRPAERFGPGVVMNEIWEDINRAGLVIAEVSEPNANVWYELGLAHALNKKTIMLWKHQQNNPEALPLPFDVRSHRVLMYEPDRGDLTPKLRAWLESFTKGSHRTQR
jgi:NDP-sugar pyrophosphorylase family protein